MTFTAEAVEALLARPVLADPENPETAVIALEAGLRFLACILVAILAAAGCALLGLPWATKAIIALFALSITIGLIFMPFVRKHFQ